MWLSDKWQDFELLDCSRGEKLERWGGLYPRAPGPAGHLGHAPRATRAGAAATGRYTRSETGGGAWDKRRLPASWQIGYGELTLQHKAHELQAHGHFPGAGCKLGLYNAQR